MTYDEANHPPVPPPGEENTVASGEYVTLDGSGTTDPDGDAISSLWFQYAEAGDREHRAVVPRRPAACAPRYNRRRGDAPCGLEP